jgi:hypothetical protein
MRNHSGYCTAVDSRNRYANSGRHNVCFRLKSRRLMIAEISLLLLGGAAVYRCDKYPYFNVGF